MRQTIRDVSDRAGVSVATVSNVLNSPHLVASETRTKVMDAIEALGYRPNRAARSLQARKTQRIGYRLPDPGPQAALDVFLHRLVATATNHGFDLTLFAPRSGQDDLGAYREVIRSGDVDGFVLSETNYADPRGRASFRARLSVCGVWTSRPPVALSLGRRRRGSRLAEWSTILLPEATGGSPWSPGRQDPNRVTTGSRAFTRHENGGLGRRSPADKTGRERISVAGRTAGAELLGSLDPPTAIDHRSRRTRLWGDGRDVRSGPPAGRRCCRYRV